MHCFVTFQSMVDVSHSLRRDPDIVSVVSHELRTPLTSIRGSLGLLAKGVMGDLPPDAERMVRVAEENSVRLMDLVNDLLDLEKIRSGRTTLNRGVVTTRHLADEVEEVMESVASQFGVKLRVRADGGSAVVDGEKIVRVLINLVGNAIRHSPCGAVVEVDCRVWRDHLVLAVVDRGPGVPVDSQTRIFEPFEQVAPSGGGTGLGLAICREIVESHGGVIGVANREGGGARFFVEIPAASAGSADG